MICWYLCITRCLSCVDALTELKKYQLTYIFLFITKAMFQMGWSSLLLFAYMVVHVQGHGTLMDPPNRASLWRVGYNTPRDYDDTGNNCGGSSHQHLLNGGKCGICGDPYDEPQPRKHELGGMYGLGYIVANYTAGEVISTKVNLGFSHYGFWELRICPDAYNQEQACFDNYLLELEDGGTKFYPTRGAGSYNITYRLPADLTCKHCVLQWQYITGNNWGVCANGTEGIACGKQEHFLSCSDISIEPSVKQNRKESNYRVSTETSKLLSPARSAIPRYSTIYQKPKRNDPQNF